jgi:hypothetical protein
MKVLISAVNVVVELSNAEMVALLNHGVVADEQGEYVVKLDGMAGDPPLPNYMLFCNRPKPLKVREFQPVGYFG